MNDDIKQQQLADAARACNVLGKLGVHINEIIKMEHDNPRLPAHGFGCLNGERKIISRKSFSVTLEYYSTGVNSTDGMIFPADLKLTTLEAPLVQKIFTEALNEHKWEVLKTMLEILQKQVNFESQYVEAVSGSHTNEFDHVHNTPDQSMEEYHQAKETRINATVDAITKLRANEVFGE